MFILLSLKVKRDCPGVRRKRSSGLPIYSKQLGLANKLLHAHYRTVQVIVQPRTVSSVGLILGVSPPDLYQTMDTNH